MSWLLVGLGALSALAVALAPIVSPAGVVWNGAVVLSEAGVTSLGACIAVIAAYLGMILDARSESAGNKRLADALAASGAKAEVPKPEEKKKPAGPPFPWTGLWVLAALLAAVASARPEGERSAPLPRIEIDGDTVLGLGLLAAIGFLGWKMAAWRRRMARRFAQMGGGLS